MTENQPETAPDEPVAPPPVDPDPIDPWQASAKAVLEALEAAGGDEVQRILDAERSRPDGGRKTVLSWAEGRAPQPDEDGYTRVPVPPQPDAEPLVRDDEETTGD